MNWPCNQGKIKTLAWIWLLLNLISVYALYVYSKKAVISLAVIFQSPASTLKAHMSWSPTWLSPQTHLFGDNENIFHTFSLCWRYSDANVAALSTHSWRVRANPNVNRALCPSAVVSFIHVYHTHKALHRSKYIPLYKRYRLERKWGLCNRSDSSCKTSTQQFLKTQISRVSQMLTQWDLLIFSCFLKVKKNIFNSTI